MTDSFNAHQEDVRRRTDSVARAVFLLSGGALTVAIGTFTRADAPELSAFVADVLKVSLWGLFTCIIALATMLLVIIARDYFLGERWRVALDNPSNVVGDKFNKTDLVIWTLALIGYFAFLVGFLGLAFVASSVI